MFGAALFTLGCCIPTIALYNTITFNALEDSERQFAAVRVASTVGWIVAGLVVGGWLHGEATNTPIRLAGAVTLVYGSKASPCPLCRHGRRRGAPPSPPCSAWTRSAPCATAASGC